MKILYELLIGIPVKLSMEILEKIREEIDKERLITKESIRERLQQLQLLLQDGQMSEEEYENLESQLIERLKEAT